MSASPAPPVPAGRRVAVMQPYLYPYGGYFRLIDSVDLFVVYDCVQFPRRGRVHRAEVPGPDGTPEWLTLPLSRHPQDIRIADLAFAPDARARLDDRLNRYAWLARPTGPVAGEVRAHLGGPLDDVVGFLVEGIRLVCRLAGIGTPIVRSSALGLDPALRGQERVIAIAEAHGARVYVNPPGGFRLYDPDRFAVAGMALRFLAPYDGSLRHLLPALLAETPGHLRADLVGRARLVSAHELRAHQPHRAEHQPAGQADQVA